jgi:hypothetical protein
MSNYLKTARREVRKLRQDVDAIKAERAREAAAFQKAAAKVGDAAARRIWERDPHLRSLLIAGVASL